MTTTKDVAEWMFEEVKEKDYLEHGVCVSLIADKFGEGFIYNNESGGLSIAKKVINVFNKISGDDVVWLRNEKAWTSRKDYHQLGRQQS